MYLFLSFCRFDGRESHSRIPRYRGLLKTFVLLVKSFFNLTLVVLLRSLSIETVLRFSLSELRVCIIFNRFLLRLSFRSSILYLSCNTSLSCLFSTLIQYSILRSAFFCRVSSILIRSAEPESTTKFGPYFHLKTFEIK